MAAIRTFQRLTFFGTSSGVPTPFRNVSSYCMSFTDGAVWMIDCGEGTQHRLQDSRNTFVSSGRIERIFLTHLHGDHSFGLPGLMCTVSTMWGGNKRQPSQTAVKSAVSAAAAIAKSSSSTASAAAAAAAPPQEDEASDDEGPPHTFLPFSTASQYFELVGPQGTAEFIRTSLKLSESFMQYRYRVTELLPLGAPSPAAVDPAVLHPCEAVPVAVYPNAEGVYENFVFRQSPRAVASDESDTAGSVRPTSPAELAAASAPAAVGGLIVKAVPLTHRVFCLGYSVTEPALPGTLDMATCTALGVPKGPLLSQLKQGKAVTFQDLKDKNATVTVTPDQVVGAPIVGRTALLLGDTCDSTNAHKIAQGCDLVVHESTFDDGSAHLAVDRGHSTSRMAAKFACELEAKQLVLTHFSARFVPPSKDPGPMAALLAQAEDEVRQYGVTNPQAAGKGPSVITVEDFTSIDLQSRKK